MMNSKQELCWGEEDGESMAGNNQFNRQIAVTQEGTTILDI
jgi:hypothetical protein